MLKDYKPYLNDIIEYCDRIIKGLEDVSLEKFRSDTDLQDATIRRFEIIGEAVKRIPDEAKRQYPEIPWKKAAGFRDTLIHDYQEIVIDVVYITAKEHLPQFKKLVEAVLNNLTK